MASYSIEFAKGVRKDFRKLPKRDAERIIKAIGGLARDPRPSGYKKLVGEDLYRIRIGSYRVLYEIHAGRLVVAVVKVGQRGDVYRD